MAMPILLCTFFIISIQYCTGLKETAPVVTVEFPRVGQALQYDIYLGCQVEAYPPPAIYWLKDDVVLSTNQHYQISHFGVADESTHTSLKVISVDKKQYGLFKCRAVNKLGTAEGIVELYETIDPVCPPACGVTRRVDEPGLTTTTTDNTNNASHV